MSSLSLTKEPLILYGNWNMVKSLKYVMIFFSTYFYMMVIPLNANYGFLSFGFIMM